MRFPISTGALLGALLLTVPAHAAPVSAIRDFLPPSYSGDSAPIIKVQRSDTSSPFQVAPGNPSNARTGQRPPVVSAPRPVQQQGQRATGQRPPGGGQQYGGGGNRDGGYRGGYRGDGYRGGYRGDRDRGNDDGAAVAGALGGLLLGAIIANESQRGAGNDCTRYRSYDPRSQTFVAGDGRRYRCR